MRYCKEIGVFSIDRPKATCKHATPYCAKHCYNNKLYTLFPNMSDRDIKNAIDWQSITGNSLSAELDRKQLPTKRIRLMTRGESFADVADVYKVRDLLLCNPRRLFWIPTRAWRCSTLRPLIEKHILHLHNSRVMASVDPSNNADELPKQWSIMGFGWKTADEMESQLNLTGAKNCPKTHDHVKGACRTCRGRCFSSKRTVVFLDKH